VTPWGERVLDHTLGDFRDAAVVDERETVLTTCLGHADWLSDYAEEDPTVRFALGRRHCRERRRTVAWWGIRVTPRAPRRAVSTVGSSVPAAEIARQRPEQVFEGEECDGAHRGGRLDDEERRR
jgi:hypothetical protein